MKKYYDEYTAADSRSFVKASLDSDTTLALAAAKAAGVDAVPGFRVFDELVAQRTAAAAAEAASNGGPVEKVKALARKSMESLRCAAFCFLPVQCI